jgi:drug/metabolite transporter (DMT)-like permease
LVQGVIVTALSYYMQMWTIAKRGPVFLAMSMPLTFVFTIVISSIIIGDAVSLGRYRARSEEEPVLCLNLNSSDDADG